MKYLPIFAVIAACVSGCDSSSNSENSQKLGPNLSLEGVWHSSESGFLIIDEYTIQQLDDIRYLNCRSENFETLYTASNNALYVENPAVKFNHYTIKENQLTVTGDGHYLAVYEAYTQALPERCDAGDLQGRWQRSSSGSTVLLDFNAGRSGFYYAIASLDCLPASRISYFAQGDKIVQQGLQYEMHGTSRLDNNDLVIDWFEAQMDTGELKALDVTDRYSMAQNNTTAICGNSERTNTVEVNIGFNALPNQLESYLEQTLQTRLYWSVAIIFDVDNSGDISTGDMQFTMNPQSSKQSYQSSWAALGGTLGYIQKRDGSTLRSNIGDLSISVSGNHMKLMAKASEFEQLGQISAQTPVQIISNINFDGLSQSDRYPDLNASFSNTGDNALLEDDTGDAVMSEGWSVAPLLDIVTVEIGFAAH